MPSSDFPRSARRLMAAAFAALATASLLCFSAVPADAEEGYRYWNYHHLSDGSWKFSQVGAAGYQPKDGDVEGYRFGTTPNSDTDGVPPRADLDKIGFESVCGGEKQPRGDKRVAVLIDFGTEADADGRTPPTPRAECAVAGEAANGQQVLAAVADVRTQDGLVCAVDGYPVTGCGDPVADAQQTGRERSVAFALPATADQAEGESAGGGGADSAGADGGGDSDLLWPAVGVALVAGLIGAGAFAVNRRRHTA